MVKYNDTAVVIGLDNVALMSVQHFIPMAITRSVWLNPNQTLLILRPNRFFRPIIKLSKRLLKLSNYLQLKVSQHGGSNLRKYY